MTDDLATFYTAGYSLADREEGMRMGRWRALGARTKAAHARTLSTRAGLRPERVVEIGCGDGSLLQELALAWPDEHVELVHGTLDGRIVWPPRGSGGHGYDPCFQPKGDARTNAEMTEAEKNAISHRGRAFRRLVEACFK